MGVRRLLYIKKSYILLPESNLICECVFAPDASKTSSIKAVFGKVKPEYDDCIFGGIYTGLL